MQQPEAGLTLTGGSRSTPDVSGLEDIRFIWAPHKILGHRRKQENVQGAPRTLQG